MKRKTNQRVDINYGQLENRKLLAADLGLDAGLRPTMLPGEECEPTTFVSPADATDSEVQNTNVEPLISQIQSESETNTELATTEETNVSSDVVLSWNSLFNDILVDSVDNQNPGYASRSMAMLNVAIYDSVTLSTGDSTDTFYNYGAEVLSSSHRVSTELTASQAAYTVLSSLYPDQQVAIDAHLNSVLVSTPQNAKTASSISLGTAIGIAIIDARADDGSDAVVDYNYSEGIGSFQADPLNPDVPVWGPGWGEVETFAITSTEEFIPETTPAITSEEYAASYNEVKELGSVDSTSRTADQTEAGIFWAYDREGLGTPLSLFSDVLETIAIQEGNTLEENAALFAQASVAMADAAIVAWQTKFSEEFWRPVTAIQEGDSDGNTLTEGDSDWTALGAPDGGDDIIGFTPQFPTYISGHATFGGALFGALQDFYGTDDIAFDLTSHELEILLEDPDLQEAYGLTLDDATRSFDTLSQAMAENGRSRVYLGIHFDFDDLVGQEVGQAVASAVASEFVIASENGNMKGNGNRPTGRRGPGDGERGQDGRVRRERGDMAMDLDRSGRRPMADRVFAGEDVASDLKARQPDQVRMETEAPLPPTQSAEVYLHSTSERRPLYSEMAAIHLVDATLPVGDRSTDGETGLNVEEPGDAQTAEPSESNEVAASEVGNTPEETEDQPTDRERRSFGHERHGNLDSAFSELGQIDLSVPMDQQLFSRRNDSHRRG